MHSVSPCHAQPTRPYPRSISSLITMNQALAAGDQSSVVGCVTAYLGASSLVRFTQSVFSTQALHSSQLYSICFSSATLIFDRSNDSKSSFFSKWQEGKAQFLKSKNNYETLRKANGVIYLVAAYPVIQSGEQFQFLWKSRQI